MEDLFFANPWNPVRRPYYAAAAGAAPPQRMVARPAARPAAWQVTTPMDVEAHARPRVVSIPVHFVESSEEKREEKKPSTAVISDAVKVAAAVRVQKAFRGFTVRKNVKVVKAAEVEVAEMEKKVEEEGKISNEKDKLKVNEMLMRLLLKLDSVRGVRDYRKKVIKRVIALQERIDFMSSAAGTLDSGVSPDPGTLENKSSSEKASPSGEIFVSEDSRRTDLDADRIIGRTDLDAGDGVDGVSTRAEVETDVLCSSLEDGGIKENVEAAVDLMHTDPEAEVFDRQALAEETLSSVDGVTSEKAEEEEKDMQNRKVDQEAEGQMRTDPEADGKALDQEADMEDNHHADSEGIVISAGDKKHADPEAERVLDREAPPMEEADDCNTNIPPDTNDHTVRSTVPEARQSKDESMKEVMERVAVESERLKGLVAELCERSTQQCRLMSGLAERVVHLERVVQRMEKENNNRKKKRRATAAPSPSNAVDGKYRTPKK